MTQLDFPVTAAQASRQATSDERYDRKSSNDADSRSTSRSSWHLSIYRVFAKWSDDGSLDQAFIASVKHLAAHGHRDLGVLHGDGTNTVAKKGGDGIGYSGHKIITLAGQHASTTPAQTATLTHPGHLRRDHLCLGARL
jgi:hypothetical protein